MPNPETAVNLQAEQVALYLQQHSDFFTTPQGLETLKTLRIPHVQKGEALSLLEHQVQVLREAAQRSRQQLAELTQIARQNKSILEELQRLLIVLLRAESVFELITNAEKEWQERFGIMRVRTLTIDHNVRGFAQRRVRAEDAPDAVHQALLDNRICAVVVDEEVQNFIGDDDAVIQSLCLMPLMVGEDNNMIRFLICFGSADPDAFIPDTIGTLLLEFTQQILQILLFRLIHETPS